MPPPNRPETSAFSLRRVGWTLCLLACVLVIGVQTWTWRQHRAWWAWFQDARTGYILWSTVAQREAMDVVGDVDGLTRAEVRQRLEAAFGPDRPFPTPPTPPGAMVAMPWMPEPPREYPVEWRVRERDWWITVTIFDGRADGLFVDTMRRVRAERRPPRSSGELWWLVIGGCTVVGGLGLGAAGILWVLRRDHRPAVHACLMACVLVTVIVLAEDWNLGIGLNWRPLVFGAERMPNVPWKSTVVGFAIGLIAMRIPARRGPPGICASCGYNLTGNASGVCPECGTTIPAPTIPA